METVSRRSTWAVVKWSVVCTAKKGFVDAFYNLSLVAVGYPQNLQKQGQRSIHSLQNYRTRVKGGGYIHRD